MEKKPAKAIVLLTTYDCNLRCTYCYEPKTAHHKMSIDTAKKCILQAIESMDDSLDGIIVQFMGGEPLMQFDLIKEVTEWLWSTDLGTRIENVQAPTNGTLLTDEMKEWLLQNRDKFRLSISFDGDRLMQNMNRSGSFPKVDLDFFAMTYPNVPVKMTVSPATVSHFYEGYKFLHDQGFRVVESSLAVGKDVGWKSEHLSVLRNELEKFIEYFANNPNIVRAGDFNIPVWDIFDKNLPDRSCKLGPEIVCYDYDGTTYPCHIFSPISMGKVDALKSTNFDFDEVRKAPTPCKRCLLNKLCVRCYGVNYKDRRNCILPSAFDCAQYKLFFYANCKLEKILAQKNNDKKMEKIIDKIIQLLTTKKQTLC